DELVTGVQTCALPISSIEVRWAAFVGNDRIASASRAGQLRVYEADGLKPLATIDASMGRPAISPDGTKVAFLAGNSVALLDTVKIGRASCRARKDALQ